MFHARFFLPAVFLFSLVLSAAAAEPVRVCAVTYNIHHGEGTDGRLDLPRIANVLKQLEPDLVALQEVDCRTTRSGGVDQAAELGRLTGMHFAFGKAMDYAGGQYGEAILSREPLTEVHVHALAAPEGKEPRAALAATARVGGAEGPALRFVATHLDHTSSDLRMAQITALSRALENPAGMPAILAGDLNASPDAPEIRTLAERWTDASAGQPQMSFPSDKPKIRIDYLFIRPSGGWRVIESRVIDEPVASDHRPVRVVLEWMP